MKPDRTWFAKIEFERLVSMKKNNTKQQINIVFLANYENFSKSSGQRNQRKRDKVAAGQKQSVVEDIWYVL